MGLDAGVVAVNDAQWNVIEIDDEEVSLSDSSFSDDDSSGDEGYEDSGLTTDSSNDWVEVEKGDGDRGDIIFQIKGAQSMDELSKSTKTKLLYRRSTSVVNPPEKLYHGHRHTIDEHDPTMLGSDIFPNFNHRPKIRGAKTFFTKGYLDEIPSSMGGCIPISITLSMAKQHVQLARTLLELLTENDRQDALRRRNLRRMLLNDGNNTALIENDDAKEEDEDESCPLLTMIKAGPLYKLHVKGGKTSRKIKSKMSSKKGGRTQRLLTKWKPKFVEVRKGILSYYNDSRRSYSLPKASSKKDDLLVRKNIPLQVSTCVCRAVDYGSGSKNNAVSEDGFTSSAQSAPPAGLYAFELIVEGLPPRSFAAGTEAGRQAWIQSICKGMVGASKNSTDGNGISDSETGIIIRKNAQAENFTALSHAATTADNAKSYISNFCNPLSGLRVRVPMASILGSISPQLLVDSNRGFYHKSESQIEPQNEIEDFFGGLKHFNFLLNEKTLRGQSIYGPERVFGAVMRCILERDKSSTMAREEDTTHAKEPMKETHVARYARDILKSTVGGYEGRTATLEMAVKALCDNQKGLVAIRNASELLEQAKHKSSLKEIPTIKINVASLFIQPNGAATEHIISNKFYDQREWLHIRTSKTKSPKRRFAVLSVGVLCFYREEFPRPHKLIGQLHLVGAKLGFQEQAEDEPIIESNHTISSSGKMRMEEGSMVSSEHNSNRSSDLPQSAMKRPKYTIYVVSQDKKCEEHHLCFSSYEQFTVWRDALGHAIESCSSPLINLTSMDELLDDQHTTLASAHSSSLVSALTAFRLPCTLEPDQNGISWVSLSANLDQTGNLHSRTHANARRSSRLLSTLTATSIRRSLDSTSLMPSISGIRMASSRLIAAPDNSFVSSISSIPGRAMTAASSRLPKFTPSNTRNSSTNTDSNTLLGDSTVPRPPEPTVEVEIQIATWHHMYLTKNAKSVLATIRATCIQQFKLHGGENGRLIKAPAVIKLDTLKGAVTRETFELMCDVERTPKRRATI